MILTSDQEQIRDLAHEFAQRELRPRGAGWDARGELDPSVFDQLGEVGFLGMTTPVEHGGLGCDTTSYLAALEELSWGDASAALAVAVHNGPAVRLLLDAGSDGQRREWLPRLAGGEARAAVALPEPRRPGGAGEVLAEPTAGGWRLEGGGVRLLAGAGAEVALLCARTRDGGDPVLFAIDPTGPGVRRTRRDGRPGLTASGCLELALEGVEVGPERRLEGADAATLEHALAMHRLGTAAVALGIGRAAQEHAVPYARERRQFGRAIAGFDAIRLEIADMALRLTGARALVHAAAGHAGPEGSAGAPGLATLAAAARLVAGEAASAVTAKAVQLFGGYGYMREYPVEKLLRDAVSLEAVAGPAEALRFVIAGAVLDHSDQAN